MVLEQPKVEFVRINQTDVIATSSGSLETCDGTDAPSNNCTDFMD